MQNVNIKIKSGLHQHQELPVYNKLSYPLYSYLAVSLRENLEFIPFLNFQTRENR